MRWEFFKRVSRAAGRRAGSAIAAAIFTCGIAAAQVNPHTQIRWPANCSASGMVYSFFLNACIATGAGTTTLQTNGVSNTSQTTLNIENSTTNAAGLSLTVSNPSGGNVLGEVGVSNAATARGALGAPGISGTPTAGHCVDWATATTLGDAGAACGTGGGSGYTNLVGSGAQTTVAAINSACGTGTFYATTPLSIATGGTVTCPVQFTAAGIWTIATGQTVTFSKSVTETDGPNQIFAGPGIAIGSAATPVDYAEWFGAKGDGTTDDSEAIQAAINFEGGNQNTAGTNGWGRTQLLAKTYVANTGLSITTSQYGLIGVAQGETPGGTVNTAGSVVKTTSASLNQISIIGPSSSSTAWIAGDAVQWITFSRTVAPTGTATTITIENAVAPIITHNLMLDAVRMMYMYNVSTGETGMIENNKLAWTSIGGCATDYGVYIDYTLGTTPTLHISYNEVSEPPLTPCSSAYGMYVNGNPQDLMVDHFETAALGYGNYVNGSGGAGTHTDNHFVDNIHDQCQVSCYYVTGIVNGSTAEASITIQGGWADCNSSTNACIDIEGSSGISVTGVTIYNNQQTGKEVYVNGGFGNIVTSNKFLNIGANATGALLNNTAENIFSHNTIQGASTTGSIGLSLTSANRNRIDGNVFADVMGTGVSMDSASNYNDLSSTNLIAKANIPTPVSNAGANAIGPSGSANIGSFVTWSGCTTNGNSTSCVVSGSAAASITISAIPGWFHDLIIRFNGVSGSNTNRTINVQFNGDVTAGHYQWTCMQQAAASWSSCSSSNSDTSIANAFITGGTNAGDASSGTFTVLGYSGATFAKTTKTAAVYFASGGTPATITSYDVGGLWTGTAAITSVTLTCTGNCAVGSTFEIYGTN